MGVLNQVSAQSATLVISQLLALDPEAESGLSQFEGKSIQILIEDLALCYRLEINHSRVQVFDKSEQPANVCIKGNLSAFLKAASATHFSDATFQGDLHFSGEIATARQFENFVKQLQIDWQEPFSTLFGDVIGHQIAQQVDRSAQWLWTTARHFFLNTSEYLQHEANMTPCQLEQQDFFGQVDNIRSRADRLAARVEQLRHT